MYAVRIFAMRISHKSLSKVTNKFAHSSETIHVRKLFLLFFDFAIRLHYFCYVLENLPEILPVENSFLSLSLSFRDRNIPNRIAQSFIHCSLHVVLAQFTHFNTFINHSFENNTWYWINSNRCMCDQIMKIIFIGLWMFW